MSGPCIASTFSETESIPAIYPDPPAGLSAKASTDNALIWQRIESWIAWRWSVRNVVYIAEGPGDWRPRLTPVALTTFECWRDDAWEAITLRPSPLGGFVLEATAPYRFKGTAGSTDAPPAAVSEAYRRLAEYFGRINTGAPHAGITEFSALDMMTLKRPAGFIAKAIQYSGAADLLRPYRRAP